MMRKDDMLAKAARLRERADRIEAQAEARADDGTSAFRCGPGGAGPRRHRRPDVHRYAEAMREADGLRRRAAALETAAKTKVFADDPDGLVALVAKHQHHVDELVANKPKFVEKFGADVVADTLAAARRDLRNAKRRLVAATPTEEKNTNG